MAQGVARAHPGARRVEGPRLRQRRGAGAGARRVDPHLRPGRRVRPAARLADGGARRPHRRLPPRSSSSPPTTSCSAPCWCCCSASSPAPCRPGRRCGCARSMRCAAAADDDTSGKDTTMLRWFSQIAALTAFNLKTMVERRGWVASAAFGMALVVLVLLFVLSIGAGFERTMKESGSPTRAIVLRSGADGEMMSIVVRDDARVVEAGAGRRQGRRHGAGLAGALRHHQPAQALHRHRRQRAACAASPGRRSASMTRSRSSTDGRSPGAATRSSSAAPPSASSAASTSAASCGWGRTSGRWWGPSPPTAPPPSRRSGPTPRSCSRPTGAATPSSRSR